MGIPDGAVEIPDGAVEIPDWAVEIPDGAVEIPDGLVEIPDGAVEIPGGPVEIPDGPVGIPDGPVGIPDGRACGHCALSAWVDSGCGCGNSEPWDFMKRLYKKQQAELGGIAHSATAMCSAICNRTLSRDQHEHSQHRGLDLRLHPRPTSNHFAVT